MLVLVKDLFQTLYSSSDSHWQECKIIWSVHCYPIRITVAAVVEKDDTIPGFMQFRAQTDELGFLQGIHTLLTVVNSQSLKR
jgi:hypothetical protein